MEQWLPPRDMRGTMLHFDFRAGGSYRMRLTYTEPRRGQGKTSPDSDEVEVRLTAVDAHRIEQEVTFDSDDPAFSGIMRMTWTVAPEGTRTLVTVQAEDVPEGIRSEDHQAGLNSTLENLAAFVESKG